MIDLRPCQCQIACGQVGLKRNRPLRIIASYSKALRNIRNTLLCHHVLYRRTQSPGWSISLIEFDSRVGISQRLTDISLSCPLPKEVIPLEVSLICLWIRATYVRHRMAVASQQLQL